MASDFLSWDDDLNLDLLLEEYTDNDSYIFDSDSDFDGHSVKKAKVVENNPVSETSTASSKTDKPVYVCPVCQKHLRSIAGFRGHTTKQHGKSNLKACDHRLLQDTTLTPTPDQPTVHEIKTKSTVGHIFVDESTFKSNFKTAFQESVLKIKSDPINNLFGSSTVVHVATFVHDNLPIEQYFCNLFLGLFSVDTNLCIAHDREFFFNKLHRARVNLDLNQKLHHLFVSQGCQDTSHVNGFIQLLLLEIVEQLLLLQVKHYREISDKGQATFSDIDQSILYYISGYIVKALRKRYCKLKVKECKLLCVDRLVCKSDQSTFLEKFKKWTRKRDRGGLIIPTDNFYLLVRELERVVRANVDIDKLSSDSLNRGKLCESIMESFMVKYYAKEIFLEDDASTKVIEDIVSLFLRVRGYAVVRAERNKLSANQSRVLANRAKKKSHSLRQTLK